jgi:L-iditol 2-dehydrogenase
MEALEAGGHHLAKMRQANLVDLTSIVLEEAEVPVPGPGEIQVKVVVCGVCGSDVHAFGGKHPFVHPPIVPGHEFSGTVSELGKGVGGFEIGERVTVEPSLTCGKCYNCRHGLYNICAELKVLGCQAPGAFAQFISVPAKKVYKLPENLDFDDGALVEPSAVGVHAVRKSELSLGDRIVVLGEGVISLAIVQAAKAAGAGEIIVTGHHEGRLKIAKELGADVTFLAGDTIKFIRDNYGVDGIDIVYEAVGVGATMNQAIDIVRKGAKVIVVGVFGQDPPTKVGLIQDKEIDMRGSLMYVQEDYPRTLRLMSEGSIRTKPLISARFPLERVGEAFELIRTKRDDTLKVLLDIPQ